MLLSGGIVAYLGPFTVEFRQVTWCSINTGMTYSRWLMFTKINDHKCLSHARKNLAVRKFAWYWAHTENETTQRFLPFRGRCSAWQAPGSFRFDSAGTFKRRITCSLLSKQKLSALLTKLHIWILVSKNVHSHVVFRLASCSNRKRNIQLLEMLQRWVKFESLKVVQVRPNVGLFF